MTGLVDTHCHLNFNSFDNDRDAVLERAENAGIVRILNPGIDIASSREVEALAEKYPILHAAVGVHPNAALCWNPNTARELEELVEHPKVVAVGEIGLDYYRDRAPRELQRKIFMDQLSIAADRGLPVVIHNRDATADVLDILADWTSGLTGLNLDLAKYPGVLHSFSSDNASAMKAITYGFSIGFTGPLTYKKADELREVASSIPIDNILIETDAPFLAPQPKRGSRNEPSYVKFVAEKLAELRQLSIESIMQVTYDNAIKILKW